MVRIMSYHKQQLLLDVVQIMKTEVDHTIGINLDKLIGKVHEMGKQQQRVFTDDEIIDTVQSLVNVGFVVKDGVRYIWYKEVC